MSVCRSQLRRLVYPHVVDINRQLRKHIFHASVHVVLMVASELYRRGSYRWWWRVLRQSVQQRLFVGVSESCLQRKESRSFWTDVHVLVGFAGLCLQSVCHGFRIEGLHRLRRHHEPSFRQMLVGPWQLRWQNEAELCGKVSILTESFEASTEMPLPAAQSFRIWNFHVHLPSSVRRE